MLLNFMSNALKFTNKDGCITVKIQIVDHQSKKTLSEDSPLIGQRTETLMDLDAKDLDDYFEKNMKSLEKHKVDEESDSIRSGDKRFVQLQLSIIDTGIGISEEGLKKLFMDFSKLDENSKRNASGTGLGLSICKNIIEQMGGKVEA